jgi:hypothetical protein
MSRALAAADPGPLARFAEVAENPTTMPILVQRLSEGETLKEIAKDWEMPYGRLAQWVIEDRESERAVQRRAEILGGRARAGVRTDRRRAMVEKREAARSTRRQAAHRHAPAPRREVGPQPLRRADEDRARGFALADLGALVDPARRGVRERNPGAGAAAPVAAEGVI